jgi:hypothetical protein
MSLLQGVGLEVRTPKKQKMIKNGSLHTFNPTSSVMGCESVNTISYLSHFQEALIP